MSNEDTENKCKECDDPCDDCSSGQDLTAWITPAKLNKKELDKSKN
jgi:hypothetical protein